MWRGVGQRECVGIRISVGAREQRLPLGSLGRETPRQSGVILTSSECFLGLLNRPCPTGAAGPMTALHRSFKHPEAGGGLFTHLMTPIPCLFGSHGPAHMQLSVSWGDHSPVLVPVPTGLRLSFG